MMKKMIALSALLLAGTAYAQEEERPRSPNDAVEDSKAEDWTEIDADNLMVMDLANGNRVVIELNPAFAPVHVSNIKIFARSGYWKDASIYRVSDNWVTQWGNAGDEDAPMPDGAIANPPKEYDRDGDGIRVTPFGSVDPYSAMAGFDNGWPVAVHAEGRVGPTYCYGYVGVARGADPDTGSGSELFVAIGTPPRRLDRNYALVGRVVDGMEHMSALPRGTDTMGFYADEQVTHPISAIRIASDMAAGERPRFEVMKEGSASFAEYVTLSSHRYDYGVGSPGAELCAVRVPIRKVEKD